MNSKPSALLFSVLLSAPASAYEVSTHAWMTNEAYFRSNLMISDPLRTRLGLDRLASVFIFDSLLVSDDHEGNCADISSGSNPLHCYYDNTATGEAFFHRRKPYSDFEEVVLSSIAKASLLRFADGIVVPLGQNRRPDPADLKRVAFGLGGWLMRGAIREDDLALFAKKDHDDDPRGNFFRVFNHFWDPVYDLDLTDVVGCPPLVPGQVCVSALEWATGLQNPLSSTPSEDTARRQHFSYKDATNNYWWALTRQRSREVHRSSW